MSEYLNKVIQGDCLEVLRTLPENSVDAVVTDPPYGIGFMNKEWDKPQHQKLIEREDRRAEERFKDGRSPVKAKFSSIRPGLPIGGSEEGLWYQQWTEQWAKECLRVLKPGGHLLASCAPRTYHRMATGIEDAGFEIRDQIQWVFGSGFPKSLNLKGEWKGWGTALKPANEPIALARKPISEKNIAENVLRWGTGALNIDACRVGTEEVDNAPKGTFADGEQDRGSDTESYRTHIGRWPANLIHDGSDEVVSLFPQAGNGWKKNYGEEDYKGRQYKGGSFGGGGYLGGSTYADSGSASRFFMACKYTLKRDNMSVCKHTSANIVARVLMTIPATQDLTAQKNAEDLQDKKLAQNVRSVVNGCDLCETLIVQELVRIKNWASSPEGLTAFRDFISNYKDSTPHQNLALIVEEWVNTDTTPTTANLLKLFGSVLLAIDEHTKQENLKSDNDPKRFAYIPKASKSERNKGCENIEEKPAGGLVGRGGSPENRNGAFKDRQTKMSNNHPTVKPLALMEYLIKLVSREGAVVLDPFAGSCSTLVACQNLKRNYIGIEREPDYIKICEARLSYKQPQPTLL